MAHPTSTNGCTAAYELAIVQEDQAKFMVACSQTRLPLHTFIRPEMLNQHSVRKEIALWLGLINEEVNKELRDHVLQYYLSRTYLANHPVQELKENLATVADDIVDSIYVLVGLANAMGIPLGPVWGEVQRANMAKVAEDGKVTKRSDGKILKPAGWRTPNILAVVDREICTIVAQELEGEDRGG